MSEYFSVDLDTCRIMLPTEQDGNQVILEVKE